MQDLQKMASSVQLAHALSTLREGISVCQQSTLAIERKCGMGPDEAFYLLALQGDDFLIRIDMGAFKKHNPE